MIGATSHLGSAAAVAVPARGVDEFEAPLTSARRRVDVIVERATRMLIARIRGEAIDSEGFNPELVVRGSTAPPRPRDSANADNRLFL